jgi:N-acylneuraminate cytidylyltransferase
MCKLGEEHELEPVMDREEAITRRQDAPATYVLNGAVYVAEAGWLRETGSFLSDRTIEYAMPKRRSADVDTALDLAWCELLLDCFDAHST